MEGPPSIGSEAGVLGWSRRPKETKEGGKDGKASECLVVPAKRGNPLQGNPAEERRHRSMDPFEGKTTGTPSPGDVSTRLQRIAELAREGFEASRTRGYARGSPAQRIHDTEEPNA